jgi:hypothetical protein
VLVLDEDVDPHTIVDFRPEHLDVLEQAARHEVGFDPLGHVGRPVVTDGDLRDQLDGVGRCLRVVFDDDLADRLRGREPRRSGEDHTGNGEAHATSIARRDQHSLAVRVRSHSEAAVLTTAA